MKKSEILAIAKKYSADKGSLTEEESKALDFAKATPALVRACPEAFGLKAADVVGDWFHRYLSCRVCGKPLFVGLARWRLSRYETGTCAGVRGRRCAQKELVMRHGCCEKARPVACVCAYAFECPEHGRRHVGTHD